MHLVRLGLTVALAILVAACGGGSGSSSTSNSVVSSSSTPNSVASSTATSSSTSNSSSASLLRLAGCKLPNPINPYVEVGLGFPLSPTRTRMPSIGDVHVKVLFADFKYSTATATQTPEEVFSLISPGAHDFFSAISYGRMNFQLEPFFSWIKMPQASTDYGSTTFNNQRNFVSEVMSLADANVDFSSADAVVVLSNPKNTPSQNGPALLYSTLDQALFADGNYIYNATASGADLNYWGFLWLNHESGHLLGLPDLYSSDRNNQFKYTAHFGLMGDIGGSAPEMFAYERWLLGWIDDNQINCQQQIDEVTEITAVEKAGGTKAVITRISPTSVLVIESRKALGYDNKQTSTGVIAYIADTGIFNDGPIQVINTTPLQNGETLTTNNVTITVTASNPESDVVRVILSP